MKSPSKIVGALVLLSALDIGTSDAFARGGGGSNFMNSPGYQRRLQESRGQVTNQSGSLYSQPYLAPPAVYPRKTWRKRGRRS